MAPNRLKRNVTLRGIQSFGADHRDEVGVLLKFLSLLIFFALMFLLAESMVRHHFFTGGAQDYHNKPTGP